MAVQLRCWKYSLRLKDLPIDSSQLARCLALVLALAWQRSSQPILETSREGILGCLSLPIDPLRRTRQLVPVVTRYEDHLTTIMKADIRAFSTGWWIVLRRRLAVIGPSVHGCC